MDSKFEKYVVFFPHEHQNFRNVDLLNCFEVASAKIRILPIQQHRELFLEFESSDEIQVLCYAIGRSVTSRSLNKLCSIGKTFDEMKFNFQKNLSLFEPYLQKTYRIDVDSYGKRVGHHEKMEYINSLVRFFKNKVSLKNPECIFSLLFEYDDHTIYRENPEDNKVRNVFLSIELCKSGRSSLLNKYDLKKRTYLGTTSMPAFHSFVLANCALSNPKSLIFDPFAGTGSLMISCAHFGSFVVGMDIDYRVLRGTSVQKKEDVYSNFRQYFQTVSKVDFFRSDNSIFCKYGFHGSNIFDAVICDPPYGFRESCSKIGRKEFISVEEKFQEQHIPSRIQYSQSDMLSDLLNFSSKILKMKGRLVFWLVELPEHSFVPNHPCFRIVNQVLEKLSRKMNRRLITLEKSKEFEKWEKLNLNIPDSEELRNKYFSGPKWKQEIIKI